MIKAFCLLMVAMLCTSCIEYRLRRDEAERYISLVPIDRHNLDPKLGSKAKLWIDTEGDFRSYLGGDFRDGQYVTVSLGVMLYPNDHSSIEIGVRTLLFQTDLAKPYDDGDRYINLWEDEPRFFFIGGVLRF